MGKGEVAKSSNSGSKGGRFQAKKVVKKNISKKDAEKQMRMKRAFKLEKVKERKAQKEKEVQLKKAEKLAAKGKLKKKEGKGSDDEWEDVVDDHEKDIFEKDGYFDVPENDKNTISKNDEKLLQVLNQKKPEAKKNNK